MGLHQLLFVITMMRWQFALFFPQISLIFAQFPILHPQNPPTNSCKRLHNPPSPQSHEFQIPIGGGIRGMKRNKKPLRWGCEGWRPFVGVMPKSNGKQAPPLSFAVTPTVARDARPSHPSPYRKKSRFAKKKSAPPKKNTPAANSGASYGRYAHVSARHYQTAN